MSPLNEQGSCTNPNQGKTGMSLCAISSPVIKSPLSDKPFLDDHFTAKQNKAFIIPRNPYQDGAWLMLHSVLHQRLLLPLSGPQSYWNSYHTLKRQNTEISKQIFPEKEYWGLSPNFHIPCVCERFIYSHDWSAYSAGGNM
jgi:hypothetical protein